MRTLATGNRSEEGFTFIELMVVIAIIGLATAAVMVNLPDPRGSLVDEAERFAARSAAVRDEAILMARDTRVTVTPGGYSFEQRRRGTWQPLSGKPLTPAQWKPGTVAKPTEIIFDPTGLASDAQRVLLQRDGVAAGIDFGLDGTIRVAR